MKYYSLLINEHVDTTLGDEYKQAREIGIIRLGDNHLFFRRRLKVYYIAYKDISRCFRRVMSAPAKLCCGKGEFIIENLVICVDDSEVAQIQIPGTKAAKILMEELKEKMPHAQFSKPEATEEV